MSNCLNILLICILALLIIFVISLLTVDHFKPINSLNIKYNQKNVVIPNQLKTPTKPELTINNKINSELSSHPLTFQNQIYSMDKYPFVGSKQLCTNNDTNDCSTITSQCVPFSRDSGVGVCTSILSPKTIFDITY